MALTLITWRLVWCVLFHILFHHFYVFFSASVCSEAGAMSQHLGPFATQSGESQHPPIEFAVHAWISSSERPSASF